MLYTIHRSEWQVNKDARDRDSDYCGNTVLGLIRGSRNAVYRKCVTPAPATRLGYNCITRVGWW